jgi:hypothetical protein
MSEMIFLVMLFGIPGILGYIMAGKRGKNRFLWALLSGVFPFFLVVLYIQDKAEKKAHKQENS